MRTRMHVSMVVGNRAKLSEVAKGFVDNVSPGPKMILLDALSDSHCYFGEGGGGELFLWGMIGEIDVYSFLHELLDLWGELFDSGAILKNSHILVIWQSAKSESALSANIYRTNDTYTPIIIEELPVDLVVYERD